MLTLVFLAGMATGALVAVIAMAALILGGRADDAFEDLEQGGNTGTWAG